jgi:hypothetical protein
MTYLSVQFFSPLIISSLLTQNTYTYSSQHPVRITYVKELQKGLMCTTVIYFVLRFFYIKIIAYFEKPKHTAVGYNKTEVVLWDV